MTVKQYKNSKKFLFISLFFILGFSIWSGNALIAFLSIGTYLFLISLFKTRVKGVLADERQKGVSEKAAQTSFQILMPIFLLTSLALTTAGGNQDWHYIKALGIVFSYVTCLALLIYILAYWYFDKKTGGR
ncbi:MAG: DUF2178 domain-containing protein [Candidatus Woesebacteria bacterium]|jgi:uncharacterized membrane protein